MTARTLRPMGWSLLAALLLLPLIAMQLTEEVRWTAFDFVFAGGLLLSLGLAVEGVSRLSAPFRARLALAAAAVALFLVLWAALATA